MSWGWVACIALPLLATLGCQGTDTSYFPLEKGNRWNYSVRTGFISRVDSLEVKRTTPVGGVQGFELSGPMGDSRLAWTKNWLVADQLAGTRYSPPVPLLRAGTETASRAWEGSLTTAGRSQQGRGALRQETAKLTLAGRTMSTVKTTLSIQLEGKNLELTTWFGRGTGPLRQEQRTDMLLDRSLEYLDGP